MGSVSQRTILLIEDEETLVRALQYTLTKEGYRVLAAYDGVQGVEEARRAHPDLVVLDMMLPRMDGFEVCRILRRETAVPILVLTAKADEVDRVVGLELGADDYMTKPFSMRELLARVKALLRRVEMDQTAPSKLVSFDGLEVDLAGHAARLRERPLELTPREFDLLAFLLQNRGIVFSRDALLEKVWGFDYAGDSRTVDVHVRWLREKIEEEPSRPRRLVTVRGAGYKFEG